jgi:hypothetical protein
VTPDPKDRRRIVKVLGSAAVIHDPRCGFKQVVLAGLMAAAKNRRLRNERGAMAPRC